MKAWMILGAATFVASVIGFGVGFRRSDRSRLAFAAGLLNLLIVGINSSAPMRGLLDDRYVGYRFGLVRASPGLPVLLIAGAVVLAAGAAAYIAARNRSGRAMLAVVAIDAVFAVNLGASIVLRAFTTRDFEIQLGEYLKVPNTGGMFIGIAVLVVPLLLVTIWAARRSRAPLTL